VAGATRGSSPRSAKVGLVADLGGTHVRFGLVDGAGAIESMATLLADDFTGFEKAALYYLNSVKPEPRPRVGAVAVAGPVSGGEVEVTNRGWRLTCGETGRALGLERLVLLNDFEALALALPRLPDDEVETLHEGEPRADFPMAVLGPGTGLGAAAAIPSCGGWIALSTETGHRDLAPLTDREWEVFRAMRERFGRVSVERALSGPGLLNLWQAVRETDGVSGPDAVETPREVIDLALTGDPRARDVVGLFSGLLGAVAGDTALALGARGGVYMGGGLLKNMGESFDRQAFVGRFLAKGRFRDYVEAIPLKLIEAKAAALLGAAYALRGDDLD
jgi:glucokinase